MTGDVHFVLVHEQRIGSASHAHYVACFEDIFRATPQELIELGLYSELAVPVHDAPHQAVSCHLLLQAILTRPKVKKKSVGRTSRAFATLREAISKKHLLPAPQPVPPSVRASAAFGGAGVGSGHFQPRASQSDPWGARPMAHRHAEEQAKRSVLKRFGWGSRRSNTHSSSRTDQNPRRSSARGQISEFADGKSVTFEGAAPMRASPSADPMRRDPPTAAEVEHLSA